MSLLEWGLVGRSKMNVVKKLVDLENPIFSITRSSAIAVTADRTACKSTIG